MTLRILSVAFLMPLLALHISAQAAPANEQGSKAKGPTEELRYVVYLSRHGVRSPTGKLAQYGQYSAEAWPEWLVQPGYLTPHGFHLMELFGSYDRVQFVEQGLLSADGCADAAKLTFYADSDERTRETGKALAKGLMPGCNVSVRSLAEGTNDTLFHALPDPNAKDLTARAKAAIAGRIGGDASKASLAYHDQIATLDHILATCGIASPGEKKRTSLFDIPASLSEGNGDHLAEMKGPINTASTLAENLLLEYTEGMDDAKVGWGCVHRPEIESLLNIHTAATDFTQRTPEIANAQSANLLHQIGLSMQQAVGQKAVAGALGKPTDRALFLIGHDTNLENIAGTLRLTWIVDGRRDDTPPGGALVFELWQNTASGNYSVRTFYTAQTLEQMRTSTELTATNPPDRVAVFIPGCSAADMSCTVQSFLKLIQ
jgi:4-phytase/acid phosphatase